NGVRSDGGEHGSILRAAGATSNQQRHRSPTRRVQPASSNYTTFWPMAPRIRTASSAQRSLYRRLLAFLTPHWWRMAGNIACSLIAAGLDALSFTLLIPFLNALFKAPKLLPAGSSWVTTLQDRTIGRFLDPAHGLRALGV